MPFSGHHPHQFRGLDPGSRPHVPRESNPITIFVLVYKLRPSRHLWANLTSMTRLLSLTFYNNYDVRLLEHWRHRNHVAHCMHAAPRAPVPQHVMQTRVELTIFTSHLFVRCCHAHYTRHEVSCHEHGSLGRWWRRWRLDGVRRVMFMWLPRGRSVWWREFGPTVAVDGAW